MLRAAPSHPGWSCLAAPQTPSPRPQQPPRVPRVPGALPVCLGADSGVWGRAGLCLFQVDFPEALLGGTLFVPAQRGGLQEVHFSTPRLISHSALTQLSWPCGPPRAGGPVGHDARARGVGRCQPSAWAQAPVQVSTLHLCSCRFSLPGSVCDGPVPARGTWHDAVCQQIQRHGNGMVASRPHHHSTRLLSRKEKPCCAAPGAGVPGRGRGVPGEEEEAAPARGALRDPGWCLAPAWCG